MTEWPVCLRWVTWHSRACTCTWCWTAASPSDSAPSSCPGAFHQRCALEEWKAADAPVEDHHRQKVLQTDNTQVPKRENYWLIYNRKIQKEIGSRTTNTFRREHVRGRKTFARKNSGDRTQTGQAHPDSRLELWPQTFSVPRRTADWVGLNRNGG